MDAIYVYDKHSPITDHLWQKVLGLLEWLQDHWQLADSGFWEVRGTPLHYVDSRMMSWLAFERGLQLARKHNLPAPVEAWSRVRAEIHQQVMEKGWKAHIGSFVQAYENDALDACTLLMILHRFTAPLDPLMLKTLESVKQGLSSDVLMRRYSIERAHQDELGETQGTFTACSFWLAEALARTGRVEEAHFHLDKLLSYSNDVGLYAEKLSLTGEALGNFPQALTHLTLISACMAVDQALDAR
jgi:GH15 family glucan-1,4-alpha-glucosidase